MLNEGNRRKSRKNVQLKDQMSNIRIIEYTAAGGHL